MVRVMYLLCACRLSIDSRKVIEMHERCVSNVIFVSYRLCQICGRFSHRGENHIVPYQYERTEAGLLFHLVCKNTFTIPKGPLLCPEEDAPPGLPEAGFGLCLWVLLRLLVGLVAGADDHNHLLAGAGVAKLLARLAFHNGGIFVVFHVVFELCIFVAQLLQFLLFCLQLSIELAV